jgi:hypothetical protein
MTEGSDRKVLLETIGTFNRRFAVLEAKVDVVHQCVALSQPPETLPLPEGVNTALGMLATIEPDAVRPSRPVAKRRRHLRPTDRLD